MNRRQAEPLPTLPYVLIIVAAVLRWLPHPFNVTPVGALGLFAGAHTPLRLAWLVPITALVVGDSMGGFYHPVIMAGVYVGFLAAPLLGHWLLKSRLSLPRLGLAVGGGALLFYLLSNFGLWLSGTYYPRTLDGLVHCYINALPYLGRSLLGDMIYAGLLFGGYAWWRRRGARLSGAAVIANHGT